MINMLQDRLKSSAGESDPFRIHKYLVILLIFAVQFLLTTASAQTIDVLGSGFAEPRGVAVDTNRNIFVVDFGSSTVFELPFENGYGPVITIGAGFGPIGGSAVDKNGNIFFSDSIAGKIYEALAADKFATPKLIAAGFAS